MAESDGPVQRAGCGGDARCRVPPCIPDAPTPQRACVPAPVPVLCAVLFSYVRPWPSARASHTRRGLRRPRAWHPLLHMRDRCRHGLKILRETPRDRVRLAPHGCGIEAQEMFPEPLVHLHDGRLVAALVAVIGRAENGHHRSLVFPRVSLHHQLVRPPHQRQPVGVVELLAHVLSEGVAAAAGRDAPAAVVVRVRPKEVTHGSFGGRFLDPVELANLVQGGDGGGETPVEAEDGVLHEGRDGEVVEEVNEELPDVRGAVFVKAFVVEAVDFRHMHALVVPPE
eukprot:CAMPEP_0194313388 /NCGR_PEP_ID=MMETSP0171-20130528/10259_1 /TAXON_ID=218684 /ORGANISM="Corethron pennatum, Strain L29A3" /LENGTH=282 /DNA_ID=CAMNT_0039068311 /DNA_START=547 /DNA_END=1395 /DNA_ORIENTATION=-